jgi:hypothetical protein
LAIDTAVDIVLARWRTSDDKQVLVLAEGGVLDEGPVIPDEGRDSVIALESLPHDFQASSTVSTQDYIGVKQQRIIAKIVSDRTRTVAFCLNVCTCGFLCSVALKRNKKGKAEVNKEKHESAQVLVSQYETNWIVAPTSNDRYIVDHWCHSFSSLR